MDRMNTSELTAAVKHLQEENYERSEEFQRLFEKVSLLRCDVRDGIFLSRHAIRAFRRSAETYVGRTVIIFGILGAAVALTALLFGVRP